MSEIKVIEIFKQLVELKKEYYALLSQNANIYSLERILSEVYADMKSHSYEYDMALSEIDEYDLLEGIA